MNIAFLLTPKAELAFLYNDFSIRQALEKMNYHKYSAVPVINRDGKYCGTISEGDFLWFLVEGENGDIRRIDIKSVEHIAISDIVKKDKNPAVKITATVDELLERATNQNFIPVTDDSGSFIGIVTRKKIIDYLAKKVK
ncbi:MAG: CBS domain-containing protein [Acutalibacteraceae bacterium]|nr:CBS domain-containing protein [Acutalibacteraceae bacterium]